MSHSYFRQRDKAVVAAGCIIAIAFLFLPKDSAPQADFVTDLITPPVATEHWLGNPNAPVVVVEYSDTECIYCAVFHVAVISRLMESYGKKGDLAWVYRHLPLANEHPRSLPEAIALECVAEKENGNENFWAMLDSLYASKPLPGTIDHRAFLADNLSPFGVTEEDLRACEENNSIQQKIKDHTNDAASAGAKGAPFMVVYTHGKVAEAISGTRSLEQMQKILSKYIK